jgi:hypothetical protein
MIDKILDVIFWIIEAIINILPTYSPAETGSIQSLLNTLAVFNNYLPFVEMAQCIIAYLSFCVLLLSVRPLLKWGRMA